MSRVVLLVTDRITQRRYVAIALGVGSERRVHFVGIEVVRRERDGHELLEPVDLFCRWRSLPQADVSIEEVAPTVTVPADVIEALELNR